MKRKNSIGNLIASNKKVYLSICACLLAVYALLIAGITSASNKNKVNDNVGDNYNNVADGSDLFKTTPSPAAPEISKAAENDKNVSSSNTDVTEEQVSDKQQAPEKDDKKVDFQKEKGIMMPINGKVLMKYSIDHTIYNKTLCQYMTNDGILLDSSIGGSVLACCDGVVKNVYNDARLGKCVDIVAGDYTFTYGQLQSADVAMGDLVKEGSLIGAVGEPSKYYAKEGTHLFFRVKNGEGSVNPETLLRSEAS